jgi:hypothetical protein
MHVRFWPKADIGYCTAHVRFWADFGEAFQLMHVNTCVSLKAYS